MLADRIASALSHAEMRTSLRSDQANFEESSRDR